MPGQQHAQRGAGRHHVTGVHPGTYRLVGGPQPSGVADGDHRSAGDHAGEEHRAGPGGPDGGTGRGGEVHAPVAGEPGQRGWVERAYRSGRAVERPPERRCGRGPERGGSWRGRPAGEPVRAEHEHGDPEGRHLP